MPRPKTTPFNDCAYHGKTARYTTNPATSWWVGATREQLRARAKVELPRMARSRYGQRDIFTDRQVEDPKSGFMRARYSNAPGVVSES